VLSDSEKFNPVPMESMLQAHPSIAGVIIAGQGRFLPALLVETKAGHYTNPSLLEKI